MRDLAVLGLDLIFWDYPPHEGIGQHSGEPHESQHDEEDANHSGVNVVGLRDAAADACDIAVGHRTSKPVVHGGLLASCPA